MDGQLYIVGGFDGYVRLRSVERYDPEQDKWFDVVPMNTCRAGCGAAVL